MNRVAPGLQTLWGFDISHYESTIDWSMVGRQMHFVMIKASEGEGIVDKLFSTHWPNAKAAGLRRIAYHFYHPAQDPQKQVANFLGTVFDLGPLDGLMIDWEADDNNPAKIDMNHGLTFYNALVSASDKIPLIYGSPFFLQALGLPKSMSEAPLVIAEYGVHAPFVPPPWPDWLFWQTSEDGKCPGVNQPCDIDLFNGNAEELDAVLENLNLQPEHSSVQ